MDQDKKSAQRQAIIRRCKRSNRTIGILFALLIVIMALAGIIQKDKDFSEEENRVLAQKPAFSIEGLRSKDYMEDLEAYTTDQFVLRDFWVNLKMNCDRLLGKRVFNNVFLGKDDYLIQNLSEPNAEQVDANLSMINAFAKSYPDIRVSMMLVPNAAYIMKDYLPYKGTPPVRDQGKDLDNVKEKLDDAVRFIDTENILREHREEGIYYKTDHHWTTLGAKYGFDAACDTLGIAEPVKDYKMLMVTRDFSGTLSSSSGYQKSKDSIDIYAPEQEVNYLVSDSDNAEKRATVYDQRALDQKDKYQVFFGGNHAMVDISTDLESDRNLLIFKDSYANCFVPFLLPYYHKIVMVDPRYYYDSVKSIITTNAISDILFLYNTDTFLTDNSIADVLEDQFGDGISRAADTKGDVSSDNGPEGGNDQNADENGDSYSYNSYDSYGGYDTYNGYDAYGY
ncbi:MAG: hypothetical protein HUJ72_02165 [Blautia sp.]|nr:hypothetical protein [Blautia sp.]